MDNTNKQTSVCEQGCSFSKECFCSSEFDSAVHFSTNHCGAHFAGIAFVHRHRQRLSSQRSLVNIYKAIEKLLQTQQLYAQIAPISPSLIRQSAGIADPVARRTMSPGTTSLASMFCNLPSRRTVANGLSDAFKAATASPAYSRNKQYSFSSNIQHQTNLFCLGDFVKSDGCISKLDKKQDSHIQPVLDACFNSSSDPNHDL